jgi:hypothetical protein
MIDPEHARKRRDDGYSGDLRSKKSRGKPSIFLNGRKILKSLTIPDAIAFARDKVCERADEVLSGRESFVSGKVPEPHNHDRG